VVFVSGTGYRGRLIQSIATDDTQFGVDRAQALIAGYRPRVTAMSNL
jgi:hypothetical protein